MRPLEYGLGLSLGAIALTTLWVGGPWAFALPLCFLVVIPALELVAERLLPRYRIPPAAGPDRPYDAMLYVTAGLHLVVLLAFLGRLAAGDATGFELVGHTLTVGFLQGAYAMTMGHELAHRPRRFEKRLGKVLMVGALYGGFHIQHIRGHHVRVATPEDPMSAGRGETLYGFLLGAVTAGHVEPWRLEAQRLARSGRPVFGWHNEYLRLLAIQLALLGAILAIVGPLGLLCFVLTALQGQVILETINYVEHYGLVRARRPDGRYEKFTAGLAWNSNNPVSRAMVFEVTRHSDHHLHGARPYHALVDHDGSPQLPSGYFGLLWLAAVPPLWFRVMDPRLDAVTDLAGGRV